MFITVIIQEQFSSPHLKVRIYAQEADANLEHSKEEETLALHTRIYREAGKRGKSEANSTVIISMPPSCIVVSTDPQVKSLTRKLLPVGCHT